MLAGLRGLVTPCLGGNLLPPTGLGLITAGFVTAGFAGLVMGLAGDVPPGLVITGLVVPGLVVPGDGLTGLVVPGFVTAGLFTTGLPVLSKEGSLLFAEGALGKSLLNTADPCFARSGLV